MSMADIFRNIEALKSKAEAETARAVRATAQAIRNDAIISVKSHLSAGEVYTRGTVKHVASKPGSPPNQDRGTLTRNIRVTMDDDLTAEVSSNAPYSAALEFGTSNIDARPFMTPAVEGQRVKHKERLQKAIMRAASDAK
jgi:HK97 gp10 family phage protein